MENKNSFFCLTATLPKIQSTNEREINKVINRFDVIMRSMGATKENYVFREKENIICFFKTTNRKRNGQLNKFSERNLADIDINFTSSGLTKVEYENAISIFKRNKKAKIIEEPESLKTYLNYKGSDLEIFSDYEKWHSRQVDIYRLIFDSRDEITKASDREIISLVDFNGNSGKSSFFKWIFIQKPEEVGRINYGTASQLRSAITKGSAKKLYIIDLPRSRGRNDSEVDLMSAVEDLKTGFVINSMYGDGNTLIMEPPHVIVASNYMLNNNYLSQDRWLRYEITDKKQLEQIINDDLTLEIDKGGGNLIKKSSKLNA